MPDDENRSADDAFWADLTNLVRTCQESSGRTREDAWSTLRAKLRAWTRAFAHRKGHADDSVKNDFSDFMLSWLASPGRLSSFDPQRGNFFTWFSRALEKGHADYLRQERPSIPFPQQEDVYAVEPESKAGIEDLIRQARDELDRLPLASRTAFKAIHHSLLGPLEPPEVSTFKRLFARDYEELRPRLDKMDAVEAARLLGKTSAWAYQVRSRALKRLREGRDAT